MRGAALVVVAGVVLALPGPAPGAATAATPGPGRPAEARAVLRWADPRLVEGSGLAVSRRHPGVRYVVNDSGDAARVYAVAGTGRTRAVLRLAGVVARDWEALAAGPRGTLWVGDVGDNGRRRAEVVVHRLREPDVLRSGPVPATSYRLRYPDGPHDAEALLVHPRTGRIAVATKDLPAGGLYAAPSRLRPGGSHRLVRLGPVPPLVTGGEAAPDGRRVVLRDPLRAHLFALHGPRDGFADLAPAGTVALPAQPQGESVAWTADGRALLAASEGPGTPLWRVSVPAGPTDPRGRPDAARFSGGLPSPGSSATPPADSDDDGPLGFPGRRPPGAALLLALLALLGGGAALRRRRR